jgi:dihydrofolate reductase
MGRIVYGMIVSLDGYITSPDGIIGMAAPGAELHWYFNGVMKRTAVSLYGRRMYETMKVWEDWDDKPGVSEVEADFARAWRAVPKVVVSTTLKSVGPNARLVRNNVEATVRALKVDIQGDIAVAGAGLAGGLSKLGLIDEYQLFLHPAVFGGGIAFFEPGTSLDLKPLGCEQLPQDVTLLRYAPAAG